MQWGHSDGDGNVIVAALVALVTLVVMVLVAFVVLVLVIVLVVAALVTHRPCVCIKYIVSNYVAILLTFKNKGYSPKCEPLISF